MCYIFLCLRTILMTSINWIIFLGTPDQSCFAFTCAHTDPSTKKTFFQCHVFRCCVIEAVTKVFVSFAQAFKKRNEQGGASGNPKNSGELSTHECFLFEVTLEIKEKSETANTYDLGAKYLVFFSSRSLKTREKYIRFAQLVLLSLYIFWGKRVYFSILEW